MSTDKTISNTTLAEFVQLRLKEIARQQEALEEEKRQLLGKAGAGATKKSTRRKKSKQDEDSDNQTERIRQAIKDHPGITNEGIAEIITFNDKNLTDEEKVERVRYATSRLMKKEISGTKTRPVKYTWGK